MVELTNNNYFSLEADQAYYSASQVKSFYNCEAETLAKIKGEFVSESTQALMVGSYVDAYFEGSLNDFTVNHTEIFNSRTGELKAEYRQANEMIARAERSQLFMEYLEGEKQKVFTGTIAGLPFKCKLDVYKEHERIVDLKTVADMEPKYKPEEGRLNPVEYWKWDLQMAIYQDIVYQNTGEKLPCYLAIITKEKPSDIYLVQIPQELMDVDLDMLKFDLPRFDAVKNGIIEPKRCNHCAYCRATKVLTEPTVYEVEQE